MSIDVQGRIVDQQPWNPSDVRDVSIRLRRYASTGALPVDVTHVGIKGMQFHTAYAAVTMPDGCAYIYPYAMIAEIKTLPVLDTSPEAREEMIARFKATQLQNLEHELRRETA